jgi:hypothetical protein
MQNNETHGARTNNRSPTPGPSSPMHWPSMPSVDINGIGDDDLFVEKDGEENEVAFKPVDISNFKDKLQKKLGLNVSAFPNSKPTTPAKAHQSTKHRK